MNNEQLNSIINDNILERKIIFGGPGSGKTELIMKKIENFMNREENDYKMILILSFTRAAVYEILARFKKFNIRLSNVMIMTFDKYAALLQLSSISSIKHFQLVDYDKSIKNAIQLLQNGELNDNHGNKILKLASDNYLLNLSHIIVDEAQDLKDLRANFVYELLNYFKKNNFQIGFTFLGDINQIIFSYEKVENLKFKDFISLCNCLIREYSLKRNINVLSLNIGLDNYRYQGLKPRYKRLIEQLQGILVEKKFDPLNLSSLKIKIDIKRI